MSSILLLRRLPKCVHNFQFVAGFSYFVEEQLYGQVENRKESFYRPQNQKSYVVASKTAKETIKLNHLLNEIAKVFCR